VREHEALSGHTQERLDTYLFIPPETSAARNSSFNNLEINGHEIIDMDPTPRISTLAVIKHLPTQFLNLINKRGHESTRRLPQPLSFSVDIRRTHDCYFDLVSVLTSRIIENLLGVTVECMVWQSAYFLETVNVGPSFGIQLAQVGRVSPVSGDTGAGEVEEESWSWATEKTIYDGV
jgi:hypothetical protein